MIKMEMFTLILIIIMTFKVGIFSESQEHII